MRVLVLVPSEDEAKAAVNFATDLAARLPVEVVLVRVLEESMHPQPEGGPPGTAERLRSLLVESESRALDALAAGLHENCRSVTTSVQWGVPWEVVLELVDRHEIDLVVKPARGLAHRSRVFFGATALHLFRKCPCPVWVVGDRQGLPRRILAAVDPGNGAARQAVSRRILEWAQWVARVSGAELHVVSCWHAPAAEMLKDSVPVQELDGYVDDARERAREGLGRVMEAAKPPLPEPRFHLVEGDPTDVLPRFAEDNEFDAIVMGSQGQTGVAGDVLGETAELVVRAMHSSVMTVSPRSRTPST